MAQIVSSSGKSFNDAYGANVHSGFGDFLSLLSKLLMLPLFDYEHFIFDYSDMLLYFSVLQSFLQTNDVLYPSFQAAFRNLAAMRAN